jgi:hypothetical protein
MQCKHKVASIAGPRNSQQSRYKIHMASLHCVLDIELAALMIVRLCGVALGSPSKQCMCVENINIYACVRALHDIFFKLAIETMPRLPMAQWLSGL